MYAIMIDYWPIADKSTSIQRIFRIDDKVPFKEAYYISLPKATDIIAELLAGQLDGAYIETAVAEAYKLNYPELEIVLEVPYDTEGSAAGIVKGNEALLEGVNKAIAACIDEGAFSQYVATALEQASGNIYEGLIEE